MQNGFRRSNLELRGSRDGLKFGPPGSGGVRSAPFFVQMPKLPTKRAGGRAGGAFGVVWGGGAPPGSPAL
eukprot:13263881-Alexandrium_andersonii.AAC.1